MIELIIDNREQKLLNLLSVPHKAEQLKFGDIQLKYQDNVVFVLERKTLVDLRASINDGRYKNQKQSVLDAFGGPTKLYYIIEGKARWGTYDPGVEGAITNSLLRDKIGVFHSEDIHDTVNLVTSIYHRLCKTPEKYMEKDTSLKCDEPIIVSRISNPYKSMLCQVPGISMKTADAIIDRYPTFHTLYKELDPLSPAERTKRLTTIKTSRKLNSKAVDALLKILYDKN